MKRYSIQIRNSKDWETNAKNNFDFKSDEDLKTFCYRLSAIHQKEVRAEISTGGSGKYFHPDNADENL